MNAESVSVESLLEMVKRLQDEIDELKKENATAVRFVRQWVYGRGDLHKMFQPAREFIDAIDEKQGWQIGVKA